MDVRFRAFAVERDDLYQKHPESCPRVNREIDGSRLYREGYRKYDKLTQIDLKYPVFRPLQVGRAISLQPSIREVS